MNIELTRNAKSKIEQMGGTPCGVLVRNEAGALACVSEHGRVTWLDDCVAGPIEQAARAQDEGKAVGAVNKASTGEYEFYPGSELVDMPNGIHKVYAHPGAGAVPEGWSLKKVEDDMTTITITRNSDGAWCGGGIKDADGAHGLRYEFLQDLLTAAPTAPVEICPDEIQRWAESVIAREGTDAAPSEKALSLAYLISDATHPHNGEQGGWIRREDIEPIIKQLEQYDVRADEYGGKHICKSFAYMLRQVTGTTDSSQGEAK